MARVPEPTWFSQAFEALTDLVFAFDRHGRIVYVNPMAEQTLGVDRDQVVGQSFADWVHPDDLGRALEVLALITGGEFERTPITPALYRVRRADGDWIAFEVNGATIPGPDGAPGDVVTVARYSADRFLHDQVLEALTRGDRFEDVVALLPELGRWRHPTEHYTIAVTGDDGEAIAPGSTLPPELDGTSGEQPWHEALARGEEVVIEDLDQLPEVVAATAARLGLRGCRIVPVSDLAGGPGATITVWATESGPPLAIHTYALDSMRRVLAVVLRWRQHLRQLTRASLTDHLTGVASRSRFFAALEPPVRAGGGELSAILYVDLDRFKPVNDRHGHRRGDEVLVVIAARLSAVVRPSDLVARIGGDEFAVLCRGLSDVSEATAIADRIIEVVAEPVQLDGLEVAVDASVGIAVSTDVELDGDVLLDAADRALYRAKREGRGRWALA